MKPLKKEDMPKFILLIVMAIGVLGFVIFELASGMGSPQAATAPAPSPASSTPSSGQVASNGGGAPGPAAPGATPDPSLQSPELDFDRMGPPSGGRDPFAANAPAAQPAATPAPHAAPPQLGALTTPQNRAIQKLFPQPTIGPAPVETSGIPTPAPTPLPMPQWTVTGVVLADRDDNGIKQGKDVAILQGNGEDRRFVTVGDPIGNGYAVAAIHPYGVDVRNGDHITTIRLFSATEPTPGPGATTSPRG